MFVYAGDLEFSRGARTMAEAADAILGSIDDARIVFACRAKTPNARLAQQELQSLLVALSDRVRFVGEVPDLPALLGTATAAPLPADDLYGKVDLPYAVLEACLMKVPVVVAAGSPLAELEGSLVIDPGDAGQLAAACIRLAREPQTHASVGLRLRRWVLEHCSPRAVAEAYETLYAEVTSPARA
jgi:glycosyltransferase involved in cell wall biosynthesis